MFTILTLFGLMVVAYVLLVMASAIGLLFFVPILDILLAVCAVWFIIRLFRRY